MLYLITNESINAYVTISIYNLYQAFKFQSMYQSDTLTYIDTLIHLFININISV